MAAVSHFRIVKCHTYLESILKLWPILIVVLFLAFVYGIQLMRDLRFSPRMLNDNNMDRHGGVAYPDMHVSLALVHYATTNITPQQSKEEIMVTARVLSRRGPCNLLVFGLGHDSLMWETLNRGGNTVFLEEDPAWIDEMKGLHPSLRSVAVRYTTRLSEAEQLLEYAREERCSAMGCKDLRESRCEQLAMRDLPDEIYGTRWDVIMIDAPRGYFADAPGRMSAIYSVAAMARNYEYAAGAGAGAGGGGVGGYADVLLHDVDRDVERTYSSEFLCKKNVVQGVGKLWHFQIPPTPPTHGFCTN